MEYKDISETNSNQAYEEDMIEKEENERIEQFIEAKFNDGINLLMSDRFDDILDGSISVLQALKFNPELEIPDEVFIKLLNLACLDPNLKELQLEYTIYDPHVTAPNIILASLKILAYQISFPSKLEILSKNDTISNIASIPLTTVAFNIFTRFFKISPDCYRYLVYETNLFKNIIEAVSNFNPKNYKTWSITNFDTLFRFLTEIFTFYIQNPSDIPLNTDDDLQIIHFSKILLQRADVIVQTSMLKFLSVVVGYDINFASKVVEEEIIPLILNLFDEHFILRVEAHPLIPAFNVLINLSNYSQFESYISNDDLNLWGFIQCIKSSSSFDHVIDKYTSILSCILILIKQSVNYVDETVELIESLSYQKKRVVFLDILARIQRLSTEKFNSLFEQSNFFIYFLTRYHSYVPNETSNIILLTLDIAFRIDKYCILTGKQEFKEFVESDEEFRDWICEIFEDFDTILKEIDDPFKQMILGIVEFTTNLYNYINSVE